MKPRSPEDTLKRKEKRAATAAKRKSQLCKVIQLKLDESHFSLIQHEFFNMLFIERKRYYNHIINFINSGGNLDKFKTTSDEIQYSVFNPENKTYTPTDYTIRFLTAKMKQDVVVDIKNSAKALQKLKKKGKKTGRFRYAKECNSISLSQYITQFEINGSKLRLGLSQSYNKFLKVNSQKFKLINLRGFHQLTDKMEITNAKLIKKASGYYIYVTTYQDKVAKPQINKPIAGADLGVKTTITMSEGQQYSVLVPETQKLKNLQKSLARKVKGSKNFIEICKQIRKEYEHLSNIKDDKTNKIIAELKSLYEYVVYQNDNITSWKNTRGKRKVIQSSCIGRLKAAFKENKYPMIERYVPTSQICSCCARRNPCPQGQDMYHCTYCGHKEQRDLNAAKVIKLLDLGQIVFDKTTNSYIKKPVVLKHATTVVESPTDNQLEGSSKRSECVESVESNGKPTNLLGRR
jgi:putative transposase